MDNNKSDAYYVSKIIKDLQFITEHMDGVGEEELNENEILLDSMLFRMIQISENTQKISNDFKLVHSSIPWHAVYGLRNKIVHDYGNVDLKIVYDTLKNDIPELLEMLENGEQS